MLIFFKTWRLVNKCKDNPSVLGAIAVKQPTPSIMALHNDFIMLTDSMGREFREGTVGKVCAPSTLSEAPAGKTPRDRGGELYGWRQGFPNEDSFTHMSGIWAGRTWRPGLPSISPICDHVITSSLQLGFLTRWLPQSDLTSYTAPGGSKHKIPANKA